MNSFLGSRVVRAVAVLVGIAALGGCTDFLKAKNPSAIQSEDLNNPLYINLMVNGVIGEFQPAVTMTALRSAVFGDELFNNHGFFEEREIDKRNVVPENGTYPLVMYVPLQRTRYLADSVAGRLKVLLGTDSAAKDLRVARVLAYGGFTYTVLAENLCGIPVNGSAPYSPEELVRQFALPRYTEAITVATAARNATTNTATQAVADTIINFARVGAARANLYINDKTAARTFAAQVPATFEFRIYHSAQNARENNPFYDATVGSPWVSVDPKFKRLNDPRVPHPTTPQGAQSLAAGNNDTVFVNNVRTIGVFVPNSPLMWSTYDGTTVGRDAARETYLKIATGLEAQYIVAEADGPTAATNNFVNARRAIGGQGPVTLTGDALMAELREQRRRDFYLDGHRLGDMRRYKKYYNVDEFAHGAYPGSSTGETYNEATCWPLPLSEIAGNPNVPRG